MRQFSKFSPSLWQSERFNNLPSDEGRYLYIYLLTSSHQTSAGAYRLPDGYACADLRWTGERYRTSLQLLIAAGLVAFDPDTNVVRITRWFKHNPPMNESHLKSIEGELSRLPSVTLAADAMGELVEAQKQLLAEKQAKEARKHKTTPPTPNGHGGALPERLATNFLSRGRQ